MVSFRVREREDKLHGPECNRNGQRPSHSSLICNSTDEGINIVREYLDRRSWRASMKISTVRPLKTTIVYEETKSYPMLHS